MWNTTLCYIEREGQYLMLHRVKKKNDVNQDKWVGIGGKFEDKESPEECLVREVREETGLTLTDYAYRGLVTFVSDRWETEYMHLFTGHTQQDPCVVCDEGDTAPWPLTPMSSPTAPCCISPPPTAASSMATR